MFTTMDEVRAANPRFFTCQPADEFVSMVRSELIEGRFFVTYEFDDTFELTDWSPRGFTVREVLPNGHISTLGRVQEHRTLGDALAAADVLVAEYRRLGWLTPTPTPVG